MCDGTESSTNRIGHSRKPLQIHPLRHPSGTLLYAADQIAELFAEHMKNQLRTPAGPSSMHDTVIRKTDELNSLTKSYSIFFSPGKIMSSINKLPNRRAPGHDSISNCTLKPYGWKIVTHIYHILNSCARLQCNISLLPGNMLRLS